ncbi:MAG: T9SS type A sorting domain-containing protein [Ignavibacteria bacterium]|jgi:TolB protein
MKMISIRIKVKIVTSLLFLFNMYIIPQSGHLDGSGGGIIAFISDRDGASEIYLMNADGSHQTRATDQNAFNFGLNWSRDGSRLVFCSTLYGGFEIYIMDVIDIATASFTEPVRITNNSFMDFSPTWSSDGSNIAFDSQWNGSHSIVMMNLDNGNITPLNTSPVNGDQPSWSPLGDRIAFASVHGIYTILTNSTDLQQVTFDYSLVPNYSPDGSKIAYVAGVSDEDIFIINSDGTGDHRITTSPENDFVPSWSPGGDRLVYEGSVSGVDQICVIDTDGTNYRQLTNTGVNTGPVWYPVDPTPVDYDRSNLIVNEFKLYQNYPNPFNPVTTISYSIPQNERRETQNVSLKIYDVLGNHVTTLVNEEKYAGSYEVKFDGTELSSGNYFCQLQVGNLVETRKLVLLK